MLLYVTGCIVCTTRCDGRTSVTELRLDLNSLILTRIIIVCYHKISAKFHVSLVSFVEINVCTYDGIMLWFMAA